ncbi:MAG: response regulator transcription factor [Verrucomicrobia bacterium]|nr:response regulator transcription factor [Verrucomicrobiota bacterium]
MIAIVSSNARERSAFAALCESHGWPCVECDSFRALKRLLRRTRPNVILTRHKLGDGYSDDVLALVTEAGRRDFTKAIVLIGAGTPAVPEARQIALGADVVLRDPVRTDVIGAYLAKFRASPPKGPASPRQSGPNQLSFAGATVDVDERTLRSSGKTARLTPREAELVQLLYEARGAIVTYETLYSEILGRRFRGDTSNMRVLLGKLDATFRSVGVALRTCIGVIPKTGYRYTPPAA